MTENRESVVPTLGRVADLMAQLANETSLARAAACGSAASMEKIREGDGVMVWSNMPLVLTDRPDAWSASDRRKRISQLRSSIEEVKRILASASADRRGDILRYLAQLRRELRRMQDGG